MRRKIRKLKNKFHIPAFRTRLHFRRNHSLKKYAVFVKPALTGLLAISFVLVIIPFVMTKVLVPEAPPEKTGDKIPTTKKTETISKIPVPGHIQVYRKALGKTEKVAFEDYVKGVVASEMPSTFEKEALKAQAVAARTYSLSRLLHAKKDSNPSAHPGAPVCDTVHCQVYQDLKKLHRDKGKKWMASDWKKISAAVEETKGQLMYYKGNLVEQALFHSSSGGKTENCEDVFAAAVPYLVSVESPYEKEATHKKESTTLTISQLTSRVKATYPNVSFGSITASNIKILAHSSGGRVEKIQLGRGRLTGVQLRETLGLYSANFTIHIADSKITFTTKGSGHGVGMSQYGANGMAKAGYSYKDILTHYYKGTSIL